MSHFSFEYPYLLGVILLFILCSIWCKERSRAIFFPHVKTLMVKSAGKSSLLSVLKWVGITAAVIALASPVSIYRQSFSNASLDSGVLHLIHSLNENFIQVTVYDNFNRVMIPDEIILVSPNQTDINLNSLGTLVGNWNIVAIG